MTFNTKVEIIGLYKLTIWKTNDSYIVTVDNSMIDCFRPVSMNLYTSNDEQDALHKFNNYVKLYKKNVAKERNGKYCFQRTY